MVLPQAESTLNPANTWSPLYSPTYFGARVTTATTWQRGIPQNLTEPSYSNPPCCGDSAAFLMSTRKRVIVWLFLFLGHPWVFTPSSRIASEMAMAPSCRVGGTFLCLKYLALRSRSSQCLPKGFQALPAHVALLLPRPGSRLVIYFRDRVTADISAAGAQTMIEQSWSSVSCSSSVITASSVRWMASRFHNDDPVPPHHGQICMYLVHCVSRIM